MQVGRAVITPPSKTASDLPSAKELVTAIHQHQLKVMDFHAKEGMSAKLARSLQDLALLCTCFGHLPPIRLSCIRSLMVPSYAGPCLNPNCTDKSCHGNQLQVTPQHGLHLHLPHHKNEKNWGRAAISFSLPPELANLLKLHLSEGWTLLTEYNGAEDACHVFVDMQGRPFNHSNFSGYWSRIMKAIDAPLLSPSLCRQVFVLERRSEERVAGPSDRGAAMVMGHSVKQWDKWYDLNFHARQAQQAVNAMTTWRQALLSPAAQPQQAPVLQQPQPASQPQQQPQLAASPAPIALHSHSITSPMLALPSFDEEDGIYVDISE